LFGRGVSDNKTGVTALVSTVLRLKAEKFRPSRDLLFALIGDEETDKLTTRLVARHPWVEGTEFAINSDNGGGRLNSRGEATLYFMEGAEKTHINIELTTSNPGGHGSLPREDNAIYELAEALVKVKAHRFPVRANELTRAQLAAFADSREGEIAAALRAFSANPGDQAAADRLAKEPEFLALTRTTCVATMIQGGQVTNALPEHGKANLNCRIFPGETVEEVRETIVKVVADPKVTVKVVGNPQISPASLPRKDVMQAIERALRRAGRKVPVIPSTATGGSDGKVYRAEGIPTFGSAGTFIGASANEHGIDERLPVSAFQEAIEHFYLLARELGR
jgi:acetylornithine deacetylase/succinyl-diaminopimelate desuccinylase-like protein